MQQKRRVMFVCLGNICRSPMAEFIFKDMLKKRGLDNKYEVFSSATSSDEIYMGVGNPVYPPARRELSRHGISSEGKYAIQLTRLDYDKYDLIIGMDSANMRNMHRLFGADPMNKIKKLMEYTDRGGDVADPWYTGDFEVTYRDVFDGCEALLKSLL